MSLLSDELKVTIPELYSTDGIDNPDVHAKLFALGSNWTWYLVEFDGKDLCFGLVIGHEAELGYFRLSELESIKFGPIKRIERDLHFKKCKLNDVMKEHGIIE